MSDGDYLSSLGAGGGSKSKFEDYMPESRAQMFFLIVAATMVILYFVSGKISTEIGQTVNVGGFAFIVLLAIIIWVLAFAAAKIARRDVIEGEQWAMIVFIFLAVIALFYFFPGIVPAGFKGSMMDLTPQIQSIIGGP
jgi:uncharacterized membrane protein